VRESATCLNQRQVTGSCIGILDGSGREDDTVADDAIACNLHAITEHAVGANHRVVTDMGAFEQIVMIADDGSAIAIGTAVDDHVLADDIIVANVHIRLLTTIVEILWQGGDDRTLMNLIVITDTCSIEDGGEGHDDTVIANLYVVLDIHEGEYLTIITDFRLWRYLGFGTDFTHFFEV